MDHRSHPPYWPLNSVNSSSCYLGLKRFTDFRASHPHEQKPWEKYDVEVRQKGEPSISSGGRLSKLSEGKRMNRKMWMISLLLLAVLLLSCSTVPVSYTHLTLPTS